MSARPLLLALALLLAFAGSVRADRETAEFQAKRADKALKDRTWDAAADLYRKALQEDPTYLPAKAGLAEALAGAGKTQEAVETLRQIVDDAERQKPLPPAWGDLAAKARKRLDDLDTAGAALDAIGTKYADDLVALAARCAKADPVLAEKALRRALRAAPGHAKATDLAKKMGLSPGAGGEPLFDGKSVAAWSGATGRIWSVVNGALVGDVADGAYEIHPEVDVSGDFDVALEGRLVEGHAYPLLALQACLAADEACYKFGFVKESVFLDEKRGPAEEDKRRVFSVLFRNLKRPFDPKEWNVFELKFKGDEVTAWIDGVVVGKDRRSKERTGGFVSVVVQDAKAEVRRLEIVRH